MAERLAPHLWIDLDGNECSPAEYRMPHAGEIMQEIAEIARAKEMLVLGASMH